jgi:hypothetical protein
MHWASGAFGAHTIFAILGPALLLAGAWRTFGSRPRPLQGRTWLIIGAIFSIVALGLGWLLAPP